VVVRKIIAGLFVLLIVLPFTEPWPTCPLADLNRGPAGHAMLPMPPLRDASRVALLKSPIPTAPDIANPITLLPPLRTKIGALRISIAVAPAVPALVDATAFTPICYTPGLMSRSGPSVSPGATPTLRL